MQESRVEQNDREQKEPKARYGEGKAFHTQQSLQEVLARN